MRIFIANLMTETNTFSPMPTELADFEQAGIYRGDVTVRSPDSIQGTMPRVWRELAENDGHQVIEGLATFAQPAGRTRAKTYEGFRDEILQKIRDTQPLDVVLLGLHGAMAAEGYDDCEGDLLQKVRTVCGNETVVGAVLDLHCHLTEQMVRWSDALIAYKEYPHVDVSDRARELYTLCVKAAAGEVRPVTAVYDCGMIGMWRTTDAPLDGFVRAMQDAETEPGILSVSLGHGFPWADVSDVGAKLWVIADRNAELARTQAAKLGQQFVRIRNMMRPSFIDVDAALDAAAAETAGPVLLADIADNAGGGAPGDSTFILRRLVERGERDVALGCIWDPQAVTECFQAGTGATLSLRIGGRLGALSGRPVELDVIVRATAKHHVQTGLEPSMRVPLGPSVWVAADGIDIILSSTRSQVFAPDAFSGVGIDPTRKRLLVVKSTQHFRAAFAPIVKVIHYVDTPGTLRMDFENIPYSKRSPDYWPKVEDPPAHILY